MKHSVVAAVLMLALGAGVGLAGDEGGGWGMFGPYVGMYNVTDFGRMLADSHGFEQKLNPYPVMFGGSGLAQIGRVTIGGTGFSGEQTISSSDRVLGIDYSAGYFQLGYLLVSAPHFKFGPELNIGAAGFTVKSQATGTVPGFDDLLQNGVHNWEITNNSLALGGALNFIIPISFVGLNVKAGYLFTPMDRTWKLGEVPVAAPVPRLGSSGPYLSLQVMFGGSDDGKPAKVKVKTKPVPDDDDEEEDDEPEDEDDEGGK